MSSKGRLGDPWYWDTELLEWEWVLEIKEALGWREQLAREEAKKGHLSSLLSFVTTFCTL